jgi:hypothetical protein
MQMVGAARPQLMLGWALQLMLMIEIIRGGPVAMASQTSSLLVLLEQFGERAALGQAVADLAKSGLPLSVFARPGWPEAITTLRETLRDVAECALPLQMLAAVARASGGDARALLELPAEVRTLLQEVPAVRALFGADAPRPPAA